jgi:hypothetical protein
MTFRLLEGLVCTDTLDDLGRLCLIMDRGGVSKRNKRASELRKPKIFLGTVVVKKEKQEAGMFC